MVHSVIELGDILGMIAGWAAAAPTAVGGATINDLFVDRERAVAMAVYIAGPLIGANV